MVLFGSMGYRSFMRILLGILLVVSACLTALAIPSQELKDRYQSIIERKPFNLRPPAPPPTNNVPSAAEAKPKNDIFLTGIASIGYPRVPKKAFLLIKEQSGKRETNYLSLTEGQRMNDIEVMAINEKDHTVRIKTPDTGEILLSFKTHGITNAVVAMPTTGRGLVPGAPGAAPGAIPPPPPMNQPFVPGQPGANPNQGNPAVAVADPNQPGIVQNSPGNTRSVPSRPMRTRGGEIPPPGNYNANPQPQPQPDVATDPAQDYLRRRLQEEAAAAAGIPLPPTPP